MKPPIHPDEQLSRKKNTVLTVADITAILTILSVVPYEVDKLGVVVPPQAKAWAIGIGAFATLALRLYARWVERQRD